MVKCLHKGFNHPGDLTAKIGSLQMFMENNGSCEDIGPGAFPVKEVHKISVLDMRLANADRHAGNILIGKEKENDQAVLIPIDHGYCLPTSVSTLFLFPVVFFIFIDNLFSMNTCDGALLFSWCELGFSPAWFGVLNVLFTDCRFLQLLTKYDIWNAFNVFFFFFGLK